jgi:hypothetical protein
MQVEVELARHAAEPPDINDPAEECRGSRFWLATPPDTISTMRSTPLPQVPSLTCSGHFGSLALFFRTSADVKTVQAFPARSIALVR